MAFHSVRFHCNLLPFSTVEIMIGDPSAQAAGMAGLKSQLKPDANKGEASAGPNGVNELNDQPNEMNEMPKGN